MPDVDLGRTAQAQLQVELRRPNGSNVVATAFAQIPFVSPPRRGLKHVLMFKGLTKADVPLGTEVWLVS